MSPLSSGTLSGQIDSTVGFSAPRTGQALEAQAMRAKQVIRMRQKLVASEGDKVFAIELDQGI
jgi:hypothetical protein